RLRAGVGGGQEPGQLLRAFLGGRAPVIAFLGEVGQRRAGNETTGQHHEDDQREKRGRPQVDDRQSVHHYGPVVLESLEVFASTDARAPSAVPSVPTRTSGKLLS